PFGYKKINRQLFPDEKEAATVKEIFNLFLNGFSTAEIANHLNTNHPNVVVESACIGIPKRINGTVVTVECGRIEFAQKNSLSNFVKSYSGFVGIMKESALHRAQAISTPSNLPG
ncbi:MAG: hypothetical protein MR466_06420, partial [Ruminococcus sp.]|nr:hypothetical protein [Ruminococcus sp.]